VKKRRVVEGDIYSVPLGDGRHAICRVPYCSDYFRDLVLLSVFGIHDPASPPAQQCRGVPIAQFYTGQDSAMGMQWELLDTTVVTLDDERLSRREVAGQVWVGDIPVGTSEGETAPKMFVYGAKILQRTMCKTLAF